MGPTLGTGGLYRELTTPSPFAVALTDLLKRNINHLRIRLLEG
jgi:hypothetical protein